MIERQQPYIWSMKVAKEDVPQIIEKYLTLEAVDQVKDNAAVK